MEEYALDEVDRYVLAALQRDSRNVTSADIAEEIGVAPSTVRNRIANLESAGVIAGYSVELDYRAAGFDLRSLLSCSVPPGERTGAAERALDVRGVVDVVELLAGGNLRAEVVARSVADVDRAVGDLSEAGIAVERCELVRRRRSRPFEPFRDGL